MYTQHSHSGWVFRGTVRGPQVAREIDTVLVYMNEVKLCRWAPDRRFLATEGLNSCTVVAIYSQHAGILAHIAPRTETATGDENVLDLRQQLVRQYQTCQLSGLFPRSTSIVLAAVYRGAVALPDTVITIRRILNMLGLRVVYREYRVREFGQARAEGETTFIMACRQAGQVPEVYVNDVLQYVEDGEIHGQNDQSQRSGEADEESRGRDGAEESPDEDEDEGESEGEGEDVEAGQAEVNRRGQIAHRVRARRDQMLQQGYTFNQVVGLLAAPLQQSLGISQQQVIELLRQG
ncbi:hypothetical protein LTR74_011368 [Friedmanniomyces endolithicus]|nr:hypothetical protein LTR74_011368 [Friedmanniomyces endolithicus]